MGSEKQMKVAGGKQFSNVEVQQNADNNAGEKGVENANNNCPKLLQNAVAYNGSKLLSGRWLLVPIKSLLVPISGYPWFISGYWCPSKVYQCLLMSINGLLVAISSYYWSISGQ